MVCGAPRCNHRPGGVTDISDNCTYTYERVPFASLLGRGRRATTKTKTKKNCPLDSLPAAIVYESKDSRNRNDSVASNWTVDNEELASVDPEIVQACVN